MVSVFESLVLTPSELLTFFIAAEDNPNNDYPEEETDEENSDVDDIIQYDARRRGSRVYVSSSEDEGT